jgi:tRNA threonylcarbamoyladenosine biosynthesis protein TsaE
MEAMKTTIDLPDAEATAAAGSALFAAWQQARTPKLHLHLSGPLGAGKSAFARALLRAAGVTGTIKSPTYALIEPYELSFGSALHIDLYRLSQPEELEYLGLRELLDTAKLALIEWPEQGFGLLPEPDLALTLSYHPMRDARVLQARASTAAGELVLSPWLKSDHIDKV